MLTINEKQQEGNACSPVIRAWAMRVRDKMPDEMRNSDEWEHLLHLASISGLDHEKERQELLLDWMWTKVLPQLQDLADNRNFGDAWRRMCSEKSSEAAIFAAVAADASYATAAKTAANISTTAAVAADVPYPAANIVAVSASAAACAAADAAVDFWAKADPVKTLRDLVEVSASVQPMALK